MSVSEGTYSTQCSVLQVDGKAQLLIERIISDAFPRHGFLGEENVAPGQAAASAALRDVKDSEWLCA